MISLCGKSFRNRIGISVLTSLGLGDLVAEDLQSYKNLARYKRHTKPLEVCRPENLLFDTRNWVMNFEVAMKDAAHIFNTGKSPRNFFVGKV